MTTANLPYSYTASFSYDPHNVILTLLPIVDPKGGSIYADRTTTAIADERMIRDAVLGHMLAPADGVTIWGQGFTGYGTFNGAATAADITHHHSGGIAGIDVGLEDGFRAGLAGAYTSSKTANSGYMGRASSESGHVIAYTGWTDGAAALRGGAALGWGNNDVTRIVPSLSETDRSRAPGRTAQVFADAGYSIHTDGGILEPHADLIWVQATSGAFHETGGFSSFSGTGTTETATFAVLGLRAILPEVPLGPVSVTPRFDLGWQHGFGVPRPRQNLTLNASGQAFALSGVPIANDAATAQVGADVDLTPDLTLHLGYDGLLSSTASDHSVTARLGWSF
jgi:outer membrane autotransporter protein